MLTFVVLASTSAAVQPMEVGVLDGLGVDDDIVAHADVRQVLAHV